MILDNFQTRAQLINIATFLYCGGDGENNLYTGSETAEERYRKYSDKLLKLIDFDNCDELGIFQTKIEEAVFEMGMRAGAALIYQLEHGVSFPPIQKIPDSLKETFGKEYITKQRDFFKKQKSDES